MVEARQRNNWEHTSEILALIANVNRDPKKSKETKAEDINPFSKKKKKSKQYVDLSEIKAMFVRKK